MSAPTVQGRPGSDTSRSRTSVRLPARPHTSPMIVEIGRARCREISRSRRGRAVTCRGRVAAWVDERSLVVHDVPPGAGAVPDRRSARHPIPVAQQVREQVQVVREAPDPARSRSPTRTMRASSRARCGGTAAPAPRARRGRRAGRLRPCAGRSSCRRRCRCSGGAARGVGVTADTTNARQVGLSDLPGVMLIAADPPATGQELARALAFSCSYSLELMAPESSSAFAEAI